MKKQLSTFCALLLALSLTHCKKDPVQPDPDPCGGTSQFGIPDYMAGWRFAAGTYWVMQDSATGDLDSMYVADPSTAIAKAFCRNGPGPCDDWTYYSDAHTVSLRSSMRGDMGMLVVERMGISIEGSRYQQDGKLYYNRGKMAYYGKDLEHVIFPDYCWEPLSGIRGYAEIDTLRLGPVAFPEVTKLMLNPLSYGFANGQSIAFNFFWAEPGFVRIEELDDSLTVTAAWNLVRWDIVL